jgi:hypothetical protein
VLATEEPLLDLPREARASRSVQRFGRHHGLEGPLRAGPFA